MDPNRVSMSKVASVTNIIFYAVFSYPASRTGIPIAGLDI
jgi:hypothetical protein